MRETLVDERVRGTDKIWTRDFILICLANMCIFMGFQMTMPTLPLFVEQLDGDDRLVGAVLGIFTFSALLVRPIAGRLLEDERKAHRFSCRVSHFCIVCWFLRFHGEHRLVIHDADCTGRRLGIFFNSFRNDRFRYNPCETSW